MVLARKLVFYCFAALYLVLCPLTILSTFGYFFDPAATQRLVKTGLIDLATFPPGATVYLDHRRYTERTPTVLQGLLPGTYQLTLRLKSHQPWTRTVRVDVEKATVLEKILLQPIVPVTRVVLEERCEQLFPVPGTRWILLSAGPRLRDLQLYDWAADQAWPLLSADDPLGEARVLSRVAVRDSPFLIVRVGTPEGERFLGVELNGRRTRMVDLTSLFPAKPAQVVWDPHDPRQLFVLQHDGVLHRLDTESLAIYPNLLTGVRGIGASHGAVYVLTNRNTLHRMELNGQHSELLFGDAEMTRLPAESRGRFQITALTKELFVLLGERGELWSPNIPYRLVDEGVRGVEFDRRRERLLVWRKDRVGVVDFSVPSLQWIFDRGRDIAQASWVYQGSHVLLRDQGHVWLLEYELDAPPVMQALLDVRPGSPVAYVEEQGRLYYLDRATGRLMAMALLPTPEPTRERASP